MKKICILGATFGTKNLGVNALTLGILQSFLYVDPDIDLTLIEYGKENETIFSIEILKKKFEIKQLNMRFSKLVFQQYHIIRLLISAIILKIIPNSNFKEKYCNNNKILKELFQSDIITSIAGGDSFSDIYGTKRFLYMALPQILSILLGKKLVLLPQTLGPYKSTLSKIVSQYILKKASIVYSRDKFSLEELKNIFKNEIDYSKYKFCYDVGFVIEPVKPPDNEFILSMNKQSTIIGINISGLLYIGGYSKNNMFNLKTDYTILVQKIIEYFIIQKNVNIILVPHVLGKGLDDESDEIAIENIYNKTITKYKDNIQIVEGRYDQNQIKYIIGLCDFFIGSRMHSCIAAISQGVPAVSLAYSNKFIGVMSTLNLKNLVANLTDLGYDQILNLIKSVYINKTKIRSIIEARIPEIEKYIKDEFKYIINL